MSKADKHDDGFDYQRMWCEENVYRFLAKVKVLENLRKATGKDTLKGWSCLDSLVIVGSSFLVDPAKQPKKSWPNSQFPIAIKEAIKDSSANSTMMWDYHVFAVIKMQPLPVEGVEQPAPTWWVYDFDTKIDGSNAAEKRPFHKAVPLEYYWNESFCNWKRSVPQGFSREQVAQHCAEGVYFRVVAGEEFLATFTSDRSHMIDLMMPKTKKGDTNWMAEPPTWPMIQKIPGVETNLACFINMANSEKNVKKDAPGPYFTAPGHVMRRDNVLPYIFKLAE